MSCHEISREIPLYCYGEVSSEVEERVEAHLAECPDCVAYLDGYRKTLLLGKAAYGQAEEDVPAGAPEELVQAILAARGGRRGSAT